MALDVSEVGSTPPITDELGLEIITKINSVCNKLFLCYYFVTGTALGLARTGKCMEYDVDVDFAISFDDYNRLQELLNEMDQEGFDHLSTHTYKGRIEQIGWMYKEILVDVTIHHIRDSEVWATSQDIQEDGTIQWVDKAYPSVLFEDKEFIPVYGTKLEVPVPNPIEDYLKINYGDDWKIPQPDYWKKYGYYSHRECIRKNWDKTQP